MTTAANQPSSFNRITANSHKLAKMHSTAMDKLRNFDAKKNLFSMEASGLADEIIAEPFNKEHS